MGVTIRKATKKAPPVDPIAEDEAAAVYVAVRDELAAMPLNQQLGLAEAATAGAPWSELEEWARAMFRRVSERI